MPDSFYEPDGDRFVSTELTRGPWDPGSQHAGPPAENDAVRYLEMLGLGFGHSETCRREVRLGPNQFPALDFTTQTPTDDGAKNSRWVSKNPTEKNHGSRGPFASSSMASGATDSTRVVSTLATWS